MKIDNPPRPLSFVGSSIREPAIAVADLSARAGQGGGEDDAVPRLEESIASLLGKPAAAMFPTGTMAQQVAMRIHADQRGVRTVVFHPTCHLEVHEHHGYAAVHGLTAHLACHRDALITMADLDAITEPVAALLLELPQREIGGQLPSWDELVAQTGWAGERGAATHMDGARLWEAQPFYDRPHAEIAALFDSVYVSLYKGLMAPSGAILAGEVEFVEHARVWRDRLGGNTARNWPQALLAQHGLEQHLPRMAEFARRARTLAARLTEIDGVHVVPDPPATPLFHVHLDIPVTAVRAVRQPLAEGTGLLLPGWQWPAGSPDRCGFELTVAAHFDDITDDDVVSLLDQVISEGRAVMAS
ncbi:MAG: threonine aldolase family protein [Acidimicrobiia bacterium]